MKTLIIGGAGYIGSHIVKMLIEQGHAVTVFDNLSTGHRDAVHPAAQFIFGDLADTESLLSTLSHGFEGLCISHRSYRLANPLPIPAGTTITT